jgi:hypothetical protein
LFLLIESVERTERWEKALFFRLIILKLLVVTRPNFENSIGDFIEDVMIEKNHKLN